MKKLSIYLCLVLLWCNPGFSDIQGINYLDCNVKNHDPDYLQPKNIVFKIEYDKNQNSGKTYLYKSDNVKISGSEEFPMDFRLITSQIYHIYAMDINVMGREFDFFLNLDEMKMYMHMYIERKVEKRFTSDCKFIKND